MSNFNETTMVKLEYKKENTIVISDFHMGSSKGSVKELASFLNNLLKNPPKRVIVAGDAFELWSANYKDIGVPEHKIVTLLAKLSEEGTKIVYIPGNHDRAFRAFGKFTFGKIKIRNEYVIESGDKKYLVVHGDEFDTFTRNHMIISILLDQLYVLLVRLNKFIKRFVGQKKSLSAKKHSHRYADVVKNIRNLALTYARSRKFDGIIIGHTHWPEVFTASDGMVYANSGDWIDSLSYIVVGDDIQLKYFK